MDITTLAALLGHSKLNMVTRYCHPQEEHQTAAMRRLEVFNAARQIVEAEKKIAGGNQTASEKVPTISPTPAENPANFSVKASEGKSQRIN
jgi:hypothetical protein